MVASVERGMLNLCRKGRAVTMARTLQHGLRMHWPARSLLLGIAGTLLFEPLPARAQSSDPAPVELFEYSIPTKKNYLRAFLELEALTTVSVVWYVMDVHQGHDVGYRWQDFQKKLTGATLGHDDNAFATNYFGHGVGGNAYYLSARSNHLSIGESFGFAVAGAVLWEYFGEVDQTVSINDLINTPFSGLGIGEPATQLAAFFDRQSPTFVHRALGAVFGPINSLNDAFDGNHLRRNANARDDWHRFSLSTTARFTRNEVSQPERTVGRHTDFRVELAEQLARLRGYDSEAKTSGFYSDGNVSNMSLGASFGQGGLRDLEFRAEVSPFGYYQRSARPISGGLLGHRFVVGFQVGYRYLAHDYSAATPSGLNRATFIEPFGGLFEFTGELGKVSVTSRVAFSALYGGIHPFASRAYGPDRRALPPVLERFDYYFGAGGQLETSLTVRVLSLEGEFAVLGRRLRCVDEHVRVPISDDWQRLQLAVGFHPRPAWLLRIYSDDSVRMGYLAAARATAHERAAGLEARVNF